MKRDSRLSRVLHILLHMTGRDGPVTSEVLAKMEKTNPVVVRQIMAGLRDEGYVQSSKGHGGGWNLACDPSEITLGNVYSALGYPSLLAIDSRPEASGCLVEETVNTVLDRILSEGEELLMSRLGQVTLDVLSKDLQTRLAARPSCHPQQENFHAC